MSHTVLSPESVDKLVGWVWAGRAERGGPAQLDRNSVFLSERSAG